MATVIGVRFKKAGKVYYFDPDGIWPRPGDYVIVETARGIEFGEVVTGSRSVNDAQITTQLKKVIRIATEEDVRRVESNEKREQEAFAICQERIARHKLDMKLVSVEYTFDNNKIIFYFTANGRVDFRDLVKDLASVFKIRIELRQIGVRDEAKMLGGLGPCGRLVCCKSFLDDFRPVSIKMAKEQNLSLSPTKISGLCGRLMCCLQYEQSAYEAIRSKMPKPGKEVNTVDGVGVVVENNAITERTKVRLTMEDGSIDIREYPYTHLSQPGEPLPEEALAAKKGDPAKDKDADAQFKREAANNARRNNRGERASQGQKPAQKPEQPKQEQQKQPQQKQPQPPKQQNAQQKPAQNAGNANGQKNGQYRRRSRRRKPGNAPKAPEKNS